MRLLSTGQLSGGGAQAAAAAAAAAASVRLGGLWRRIQ